MAVTDQRCANAARLQKVDNLRQVGAQEGFARDIAMQVLEMSAQGVLDQ